MTDFNRQSDDYDNPSFEDDDEHPVIYLQPACKGCNADEGRLWCQDDQGPCEECGKPWIRYALEIKRANNADLCKGLRRETNRTP